MADLWEQKLQVAQREGGFLRAWREAGGADAPSTEEEALASIELALEAGLYPTVDAALERLEGTVGDGQLRASVLRLRLMLERWDNKLDATELGAALTTVECTASVPPMLAADARLVAAQASAFLLDAAAADAHFEAAAASLDALPASHPLLVRLKIEKARFQATRHPDGVAAQEAALNHAEEALGPDHAWRLRTLWPLSNKRGGRESLMTPGPFENAVEAITRSEGEDSPLLVPYLWMLRSTPIHTGHARRALDIVEAWHASDQHPAEPAWAGAPVTVVDDALAFFRGVVADKQLRAESPRGVPNWTGVADAIATYRRPLARCEPTDREQKSAHVSVARGLNVTRGLVAKERAPQEVLDALECAIQHDAECALSLSINLPPVSRIDSLRLLVESLVRSGGTAKLRARREEVERLSNDGDERLAGTARHLLASIDGSISVPK